MQNNTMRDNLQASYDRYAQEREASVTQDWKVEERSKFLSLIQREHKNTLLEIGAETGRDSKFFRTRDLKQFVLIYPLRWLNCVDKKA